jgi:histidinol-phosphate aminotransferase
MTDFPVALSSAILNLSPYIPGKPIEEVERELGIRDASKLASNENPLGPSAKVVETLSGHLRRLHRYPDGSAFRLRSAVSNRLGVEGSRIVFGNGSNEIIVLLSELVLHPGDEVVFADPSFIVYPLVTQCAHAVPRRIPLREDVHDLEAFLQAVNKKTRLIFLCNPNNPTGTFLPLDRIRDFMQKLPINILVVLDEAYAEYVDDPDYAGSLELQAKHPNLAVLRTFSKVYGLAGLRIGYGVVHPTLAEAFQKVRQPFNVNSLALAAAEAALEDQEHVCKVLGLNRKMRSLLVEQLGRLGLKTAPSQANFVYCHVPDARRRYEKLLLGGVIVRPMGDKALRVTTGTEEETHRFLDRFRMIYGE